VFLVRPEVSPVSGGGASATAGDPTRHEAERDNTRALELKEVLGEVLG
jgi:hypothetical protein